MISAELQKAIDSLQIQDVYLRDLVARCEGDFDPKYNADFESLVIQTKYHVKQSVVVELSGQENLLRVYVDLGARWVDEKSQDKASSEKALIEAGFIAEYTMNEMLDKDSIDDFSLKNVSYHIWPYWRELLSSQCDRMHFPRVVLPMVQLAHNRPDNHTLDKDDSSLQQKLNRVR
jgi:preprotein translocase subunit SecB